MAFSRARASSNCSATARSARCTRRPPISASTTWASTSSGSTPPICCRRSSPVSFELTALYRALARGRARSARGLLDRFVGILERGCARSLQRPDDVFVVMAQQAVARLGDRLLARLGDVPAEQHAPLLAVDLCPVLLRRALGKTPLRRQGVQPFFRQRPDRDDADPVLAG